MVRVGVLQGTQEQAAEQQTNGSSANAEAELERLREELEVPDE